MQLRGILNYSFRSNKQNSTVVQVSHKMEQIVPTKMNNIVGYLVLIILYRISCTIKLSSDM